MVQIETKVLNKKNSLLQSPLLYNEIVHYLDNNWQPTQNLVAISQLDEAFNFPSKQIDSVIVGGTNGKSTTIGYCTKLLQEENLKVGAFYTPHINLYNERFVINDEQIAHKDFTELANKVIQTAQDKQINANTKDILTMMAFLYFKENNVNIALFENAQSYSLDPVLYADAKIVAVTRIVPNSPQDDVTAAFDTLMVPVSSKTFFVSADQNKQNLQILNQMVQAKGGNWCMPTRKLAPLPYPFEQLHGRCAALAQKIAHLYSENFLHKDLVQQISSSLLHKPKGMRGRPTLEAKKASETYPVKSLELFWTKTITNLPAKFQVISEKKTITLLDNADNMDALQNVFLGFRLLAYKQQFKNVSLILGCHANQFADEALLKELRGFNKKLSGVIALCPINPIPGEKSAPGWNVQKFAQLAKAAKIKTKLCKNFAEAFNAVKATQNNQDSILIITGSQTIIHEYLNHKDETVAQ